MGAAAFTQRGDAITLGGSNRLLWGTLALSSSYATNGDTIDMPGDISLGEGSLMLGQSGGYVLEYDGTNQKIKAYRDNGTATAAPLPEVAAAVNLSAVVVECWALVTT